MQKQKRRTDLPPSDMKQFNFRAPEPLIAAFMATCERENETPAVIMRDFMRLYVAENTPADAEANHG